MGFFSKLAHAINPINIVKEITGAAGQERAADKAQQLQSDAAASAATSADKTNKLQWDMYQQQRQDFDPYQQMGVDGVAAYNNFQKDPNAYLNTPAYQWQQQQIDKNMNRQLSARGRSNSSFGMNSLANAYGNLGVQEYQNAYSRILDPIKIGQGAAGQTGAAAHNYSNAYGNTQQNLTDINMQTAQNIGNIGMQSAQNNASLYSGLLALPFQAMGAYTGIKNNQAMTSYLNRQP